MRLQQQDTLRDLALSSMARFLELLAAPCAPAAAVRATGDVDLGAATGAGVLSAFKGVAGISGSGQVAAGGRRAAPLLVTEVVVSADGASLGYAAPPEAIAGRVAALFDKGLQRLQVGCSV